MSTVDFYVLNETSSQRSLHFACGLLEKAYLGNQRVYIHAPSNSEAERLDALLWTYRDDSFLPHQICSAENLDCPILIGTGEDYRAGTRDILVNLSPSVPPFYKQFKHIIEIIFTDTTVQQLGRERFKHYRNEQCEINTHKI